MLSFFTQTRLSRFAEALQSYCQTQNYHDLTLTPAEIEQLSWYIENPRVTPEARLDDTSTELPFEVKRGITRRYSFELLKRGTEQAYEEFTRGQDESVKLTFEIFNQLSQEARNLSLDIQKVLEVSCFLTISLNARLVLLAKEHLVNDDSEIFLSDLAIYLKNDKALFPITSDLTNQQIALLQKIYWPCMHLRHMIYTEGNESMVTTFKEGINNGKFSAEDFVAWKWRWLINLMGFQSGPGAKNYDIETHTLAHIVITSLNKISSDTNQIFLDSYLDKRAEIAGFTAPDLQLTHAEQNLLAHIAAYFNSKKILNKETGFAIYQGYKKFLQQSNSNANNLADLYADYYQNSAAITPTYVPAIINTAYDIFLEKFKDDKMVLAMALTAATQFMCDFLSQLYLLPFDKLISCMQLAQKNKLEPLLNEWLEYKNLTITLDNKLAVVASIEHSTPKYKLT